MNKHKRIWIFCKISVAIISFITFTPLIIPENKFYPELFGLPYTLWTGMLLSICLIILVLVGVKAHSMTIKNKEDL